MANNFDEKSLTISNANLPDVYTASNKTIVIGGVMTNTSTSAINVTLKKYDNSGTATFPVYTTMPLPSGSALKIEKLVLNTSDKVQAQSDHASGNLTVTLNLLTDIA